MNLRTRFFLVLSGLGLLTLTVFALSLFLLVRQQVLRDQAAAKTEILNQVARVCQEAAIESNDITAINYLKLLRPDRRIVHAGCLDLGGRFRAHTIPGIIGETFAVDAGRPAGSAEAYRFGANSFVIKPSSAAEFVEFASALKNYWLRYNEFTEAV